MRSLPAYEDSKAHAPHKDETKQINTKGKMGLKMHRATSAAISPDAAQHKRMEISRLMSEFKNTFSQNESCDEEDSVSGSRRNFDKYMKELWPAVLQRKSNHRLLTFILKDEAPLESSW